MKQSVYLAGGFSSGWQDRVLGSAQGEFTFFDPSHHALSQPIEYTAWDLHYVNQCDIVFAYMEATNPSGIGLSLEVGFARAMGKTIILVDERSPVDEVFGRRFAIVRGSATVVLDSLEDGIRMLLSFARGVR